MTNVFASSPQENQAAGQFPEAGAATHPAGAPTASLGPAAQAEVVDLRTLVPLDRDASIRPATDDWPFLYMREPHLPTHYAWALLGVLVVSVLAVGGSQWDSDTWTVPTRRLADTGRSPRKSTKDSLSARRFGSSATWSTTR